MAQFPGLLLWTDAWIADTAHLSIERRGLYHDMLVLAWRTPGCRLPNDEPWLFGRLRLNGSSAAKHLQPIIKEFWSCDGNWLTQKRLKKEFERAFEFKGRMSDMAKRRKNKKSTPSSNCSAETAHYPSPSPSPSQEQSSPYVEILRPAPQRNGSDPARSFASAPDEGALAREPDSTPAEPKRSAEKDPLTKTMAEINYEAFGSGTGRRKRTY